MGLLEDRTGEFFSLVRQTNGFLSHKSGEEMLHPNRSEISPFGLESEAVCQAIGAERLKLVRVRPRYLDFQAGGMMERERDEIDADAAAAVKSLSERIDRLKSLSTNSTGTTAVYRLGIAVTLVEELQVVDNLARELRGTRIRQAMKQRATQANETLYPTRLENLPQRNRNASPAEVEGIKSQAMLQALEQENQTMYAELVEQRAEVQSAESQMVQIAALNHMIASKVLEQTLEIEQLYDSAVRSVSNIDRGNEQVNKLARDRVSVQLYVAAFLILAALSLLFIEAIL